MNSSKYMDKQITQLSKSRASSFIHDDDDEDEDDQDHGFEFHPIHSLHSNTKALDGTHLRGWSSMDPIDSTKLSGEKVGICSDVELISRIDQKLKEHADVLLHSVQCLSARVSQMESRTRQVENSFDDLKESIEFGHGRTDRKLRDLENILIEIQGGIKDLRDKQEIAEAQLWLAKVCASKDDPQQEKQNSTVESSSGAKALSSVSQQSHQPLSVPVSCQQPALAFSSNITNLPLQIHPPIASAATAPQDPSHSASYRPIVAAMAPQHSAQFPQNIFSSVPQQESYCPLPVFVPGINHQQYAPPTQQTQLSPYTQQPYQPPPYLPLNLHISQLPQVHPPFTMASPQVHNHHPEEVPFVPSQGIHRSSQPHDRPLPPQLFNSGSADQPLNFHYSESTSANSQAQGLQPRGYTNIVDFYNYSAPTYNSSSATKTLQPSPSPPVSSGESSYSRLPTARILQHVIPTAKSVDDESSTDGSGNRMPVDDVVDKVVAMGFRRDLVRATVKKLTENGESVDLNTMLDKLMNNG